MRIWVSRRVGPFRIGSSFGPRDFRGRQSFRTAARQSGDYVYVVQGHGAVKIGVTSDLDGRLASLQTGSPYPLDMVYSIPIAGDAYAVEAEAHDMLDRHRLAGEWFVVPADVAVAAINGAAFRLSAVADSDDAAGHVGRGRWFVRYLIATLAWLPLYPIINNTPVAGLFYIVAIVCLGIFFMTKYGSRSEQRGWIGIGLAGCITACAITVAATA